MASTMSLRSAKLSTCSVRKASRPSRVPVVSVRAHKVTMRMPDGKQHVFEAKPDQTILDAIDEANIDVPFLCRTGSCGACTSKVASGQTKMEGQNLIDDPQVKKGFTLLCCTYAKSDVVVDTYQEEALHLAQS